jgi:hypothetical protein
MFLVLIIFSGFSDPHFYLNGEEENKVVLVKITKSEKLCCFPVEISPIVIPECEIIPGMPAKKKLTFQVYRSDTKLKWQQLWMR